ncbi:Multidrug resistance-associated protein [Blattamonas nauphoetae]|uniref:Multidrug resistance-associated protein n=1 Tax=Blattamonas nauphoetae TaxID=2049346 RepID=A0ABQ9XJR2_9EUKA|nr:Multidrug resistance-associated protein [Blattamonas nauphoetae]
MSNGIVSNVPQLVNGATLSLFVFTSGITKEQFASSVIPNLGYLTLMTVEANNVPQYFQGITMVYLSSKRIKEFLLLPEMQVEERGTPSEHNVAVEISEGSFKWPDPPAALKVVGGDKKEAEAKVLANGNDVDDTKSTNETGSVSSVNQTQDESSLFNPTAINPIESPPMEPSTHKNEPESIFNTQPLSPSPTPANPTNLTLQNINVRIEKGSLTMIVGGVGSGKSSLGAAITGEIDRVNGVVSIDGSITFCPQTPWIANTTVRNNIVFGSPFDENKYIRTVRACSLVSDLKLLSAGDQTAIGEKGGNLSGGQKARIQLARAVYADKDIIVLDDPLSAVDAHVAKFLMNECICGVLRGKTVILTTNQLQFLDRADKVILLNHGHLVAEGNYQQMKEKGINFDRFVITENPPKDKSETPDPSQSPEPTQKLEEITLQDLETGAEAEAGKEIISDEEQNTKGVSPIVYLRFLTTMFPVVLLPFFLLFNLVAEGMPTFQSFWLSTIPSDTFFGGINYQWKIISYSLLTAVALFLMMLRMCFVSAGAKRSNKIVHDTLLSHVIRCPPSFYDTTPVGRILNRFSGDLSQTDTSLIQFLSLVFRQVTDLLGQIVIVSINTPFFLFVGLPVLVVYFIILIVFQRSSRNLMRQNSMARSPVISLYSQILSGAGLTTLRNYNLQGVWRKRFHKALDHWTTLTVLFSEGKNSNQLYTSLVSSCFMAGVVILGWNFMSNAQLGVSITAAAIFSQTAGYIGYNVLDLDAKMTMFERIDFYSRKLPQESKGSKEKVQQSWPQRGDVTFENVKFRYRPGLPFVLRGVNFEIKGGEKIGVCGRTGAGKSSLLFALFRLVELDPTLIPKSFDMQTGKPIEPDPNEEPNGGRVLIDGVDISKVNLSRVRQSIAIIPQDPTLFTGSVRYNLDIAGKASDDRIWEVLDLIEMRDVIANMPAGLDSEVVEGGSNFSAGERQLLCFARAILNNCKIVVLDEATASVDVETDEKIQKTIREQFSDKTVIVIAHRLNTIMDSDRILVLGGGLLLEYDTPANLTSNADSAFCSLLASAAH